MTEPVNVLALRRSLEDRLRHTAERTGRDLSWTRRRHVFLRAVHRLAANAPEVWVVKGGFAVELRRPGLARATRDIDLALRTADTTHGDSALARDLLSVALAADPDADRFHFSVGTATPLADDAYGRPAWRFHVSAELAGKSFVEFRIDVVERPEELVGLTEITLPVGEAGLGPERVVVVTDLRQQFAEKLHALTRSYAGGTSTRVKDLVDLVLLLEDGLTPDAKLVATVRRVFAVRGTAAPPCDLGPPPAGWSAPYAGWALELNLRYRTAHSASAAVDRTWIAAQHAAEREAP